MGKWTHNYTDDVLHAKVSALVTGAIRRSAAENPGALPPTYNEFVHELDTGDSFTTTMVDILVKEVMERRKRPAGDRRLISDKTAKSLRQLSSVLNIYHGRLSRMTRYPPIARPPREGGFFVDTDEEDGFEDAMNHDDAMPADTSHMGSAELLETIRNTPLPSSTSIVHDSTTVPPPPLVLPPRSGRASPWTALPATSTNPNTTRAMSHLRRTAAAAAAARSRTTTGDLADFPLRRSRVRGAAALGPRPLSSELVTEPRDMDGWAGHIPSAAQRRFFGPTRAPRRETMLQRRGSGFSEGSGDEDASGSGVTILTVGGAGAGAAGPSTFDPTTSHLPPPPQAWPDGTQIYVSPRAVMLRDITVSGEPAPAPSLRRGGVLPPETMYLQYTSPSPPVDLGVSDPILGEPAAYPTPGSVDNEHSA